MALYEELNIYILPAIFTVLFIPNTLEKVKYLVKPGKNTFMMLLCAIFQMISTLALYGAYKYGGELSVVGPLAQTSTVLTIIIGIVVLKERWNLKRKVIGIVVTLVGVGFIRGLV